jgi:hypothetical protein
MRPNASTSLRLVVVELAGSPAFRRGPIVHVVVNQANVNLALNPCPSKRRRPPRPVLLVIRVFERFSHGRERLGHPRQRFGSQDFLEPTPVQVPRRPPVVTGVQTPAAETKLVQTDRSVSALGSLALLPASLSLPMNTARGHDELWGKVGKPSKPDMRRPGGSGGTLGQTFPLPLVPAGSCRSDKAPVLEAMGRGAAAPTRLDTSA